ncbi:MAG: 1-deoxy-D-xylulose-5-phosphate reductoisomerase, partial [Sphaerochaetaceae bacterium]|nr:1-deoxy-D-xylulose-5-phosphate reductoisomerase [Sphaerochaetaceae bacterium]
MQAKSKRSVIILGCTGSIGTTALQALATVSDLFEVVALSAHSATHKLAQVAQQWNCKRVCISNEANHDQTLFGDGTLVYKGSQGLITMIKDTEADIVLNAISGSSGLAPTLAALES